MRTWKNIALAFPMGVSHLERVAYGIRQFSREVGDWMLQSNPERHHLEVKELRNWQGQGIIGFINDERDLEVLAELKLPVVNISGALASTPYPRVRVDYEMMGQEGARHFLKRGFKNYAFYGIGKVWYAEAMGRGFEETMKGE